MRNKHRVFSKHRVFEGTFFDRLFFVDVVLEVNMANP